MIKGKLPTIPEYYRDFIDKNVDLESEPKQCCPFHGEDTPSFSYSAEKKVWRCFGACKTGGDVFALHQKNAKIKTREEAITSLHNLYHVEREYKLEADEQRPVNEEAVELELLIQRCIMRATTVERQLELDYAMAIYPLDQYRLQDLLTAWT